MEIQEFFDQMDRLKEAIIEANQEYECNEVVPVLKDDDGNMTPIQCIEGGYDPKNKRHVVILSSGKNELMKMFLKALEEASKSKTIDAEDLEIDKIVPQGFESLFGDNNE